MRATIVVDAVNATIRTVVGRHAVTTGMTMIVEIAEAIMDTTGVTIAILEVQAVDAKVVLVGATTAEIMIAITIEEITTVTVEVINEVLIKVEATATKVAVDVDVLKIKVAKVNVDFTTNHATIVLFTVMATINGAPSDATPATITFSLTTPIGLRNLRAPSSIGTATSYEVKVIFVIVTTIRTKVAATKVATTKVTTTKAATITKAAIIRETKVELATQFYRPFLRAFRHFSASSSRNSSNLKASLHIGWGTINNKRQTTTPLLVES